MTIVQADVKGLEIVTAAFLSQDDVLIQELWDKVDIHENNRQRFNLPTRLIAKTFQFRLIYGGSNWAYVLDPEFSEVFKGKSPNKRAELWQEVINEYYQKYEGLYIWHRSLMHEATTTGRVVCPTGRFFNFAPYEKKGETVWPRTTILNYPVQGTGADLVSLARVEFSKRFKQEKVNGVLVSSIHDSLVCDVDGSESNRTRDLLRASIEAVPGLYEERFGQVFNLPMTAEILAGPNFEDMEEI